MCASIHMPILSAAKCLSFKWCIRSTSRLHLPPVSPALKIHQFSARQSVFHELSSQFHGVCKEKWQSWSWWGMTGSLLTHLHQTAVWVSSFSAKHPKEAHCTSFNLLFSWDLWVPPLQKCADREHCENYWGCERGTYFSDNPRLKMPCIL